MVLNQDPETGQFGLFGCPDISWFGAIVLDDTTYGMALYPLPGRTTGQGTILHYEERWEVLTELFTIPTKAPEPLIFTETDRGRSCGEIPLIAAGETVALRGRASDLEDETVVPANLVWTVTGPSGFTRSGTGRELFLRDLLPGSYSAQLAATDSVFSDFRLDAGRESKQTPIEDSPHSFSTGIDTSTPAEPMIRKRLGD